MGTQLGLSLRYKFLILLVLLTVTTLGVYLVIALRVFEVDKIAYVFDSSQFAAKTISSQIRSELRGVVNTIKPIIRGFEAEQGKLNLYAEDLLKNESSFEAFIVFEQNPITKGYQKKVSEEKEEGVVARVFASRPEGEWLGRVRDYNTVVGKPIGDDLLPIGVRIGGQEQPRHLIVIVAVKNLSFIDILKGRKGVRAKSSGEKGIGGLVSSFKSGLLSFTRKLLRNEDADNSISFPSFLVNSQGEILFTSDEMKNLSELMPLEFLEKSISEGIPDGTAEIKSRQNQTLLASYSQVSFGDLSVVSVVAKSEAFRAVDELIWKSFLFFIALVSFVVIISVIATGKLTEALSSLSAATKRVAEGFFDIQVPVSSKDEIGGLADSFNRMAREVARLLKETVEKARMEGELKTAHAVQSTLFPKDRAQIGKVKVAGYYEPASECGGDWWYYSEIAGKQYFWIGDATGHGVPAALITSAARSAASVLESIEVTPAQAVELLNKAICDVSRGQIMMTFFLGCYDQNREEFTYCNASHDPPYLYMLKPDQPLKKKDLEPLNEIVNPRLGQARDTVYKQCSFKLEKGSRIFFYTDGVPDLMNTKGEVWGEREFLKALLAVNNEKNDVDMAVQKMSERINSYRQSAPLKDDVTIFMIEGVS